MSDLVLLDTSAWARYFRKKTGPGAVADEVDRLIEEDRVCYTEPVYIELAAGVRGTKELSELKRWFDLFPLKKVNDTVWHEAIEITFQLGRKGFRQTPMADILIATTAIVNDVTLFHKDKHYETIAEVAPLKEYSVQEV
ncbi:MAG: PIN domain-containing protein [Actinobacteria bacterium]|nr:PIN domain-containing protein [Actinomycetota bacterium]